jgi:hypothetical protein
MSATWDDLVRSSPDGWVFSTAAWQDVITAVPRWGLEELGFAVERDRALLAVMPLHYAPSIRLLSSTGFGAGGPVVAPDLPARTVQKLESTIYARCAAIGRELGAERLAVSISPVTRRSLGGRWGVNPLILHGFEDKSTHTRIVELGRSEEALWADLSQSARQAIRRARTRGYAVVRADWPTMLDRYYALHRETYERTGVTPHPREYFAGIAGRIAATGNAVLWAGLDPSGAPVAFHGSLRFAGAGQYHTGCSATAQLESGINYLLLWEAMLGARRDGCSWYEVGEVFPGAKSGKEFGLSVLKSKFGGELHRSFRGEMALAQPAAVAPPDPAAPQAASIADTPARNGASRWGRLLRATWVAAAAASAPVRRLRGL